MITGCLLAPSVIPYLMLGGENGLPGGSVYVWLYPG